MQYTWLLVVTSASAFTPSPTTRKTSTTQLDAMLSRRNWINGCIFGGGGVGAFIATTKANAQVFFDPAMYGDQELRVSAVDSVKERVRRAILENPSLAPSFYHLSLLDGLSYQAKTDKYGPDGTILFQVLGQKAPASDEYMTNLQKAAVVILETEKFLRQKNAISLPDAVAIAGAEAIESVGGPILVVQLGRMDTPKNAPVNAALPLDLFNGKTVSKDVILDTFRSAGMSDRETIALLCGLYTLERVEKARSTEDWRQSAKPKFRERGKMGRMSEFKRLSDEDIAEAEAQAALEADPDYQDPDDGWYISDSFGTKESRFGARLAADEINERNFNKYIQELVKMPKDDNDWIVSLLKDADRLPTAATTLQKYASTVLAFNKDLNLSYNSITKLGAVYTGGKYENLLKGGKPSRKTLNDDNLNLF
ncbi:hypothetical protein FisN_7Lh361 [Fistulifera solaris]|uniref:Plant heme peroxidase family profile domain-containing protein n=1 Tax=Fistulifera solaris TaxID=1519565 RepID=A0A1Z5JB90_FISSO|nr:hypothetical protein FisN_7Lh361 [Fistulifera solaris]|eukprot:GAX11264.1 hypothetical protein FisN_7Lh361 [Fistulifera solaris]